MNKSGIWLVACAAFAAISLTGCGGEEPAGSDVVGYNLEDARATLKEEGVEITLGDNDTLLGVLVESNFTVCEVHAVNAKMVRVDVAKRGC